VGASSATPPREPDQPSVPRRPADEPPSGIIRATARAFELDRYLSALLAPRRIRADLVALAAFAGEIARIPGFVTEPVMGEIRLQWWRDVVTIMPSSGMITGHPIADALAGAVRRHALPVRLLVSAIDAQSARLVDVPFASRAALSANIDHSDGALFELAWRIHASGDAPAAGRRVAAVPRTSSLTAAARAYGLARTLIEMPAALAGRRVLLPRDRLAVHGLTPEDLHEPRARGALAALTTEIAHDARTTLSEVRAAFSTGPRPLRMAILPVALVRPYLRVSELSSDAPLSVRDILPISRITRLWLAARFGVF
jgi:phytoene synthase